MYDSSIFRVFHVFFHRQVIRKGGSVVAMTGHDWSWQAITCSSSSECLVPRRPWLWSCRACLPLPSLRAETLWFVGYRATSHTRCQDDSIHHWAHLETDPNSSWLDLSGLLPIFVYRAAINTHAESWSWFENWEPKGIWLETQTLRTLSGAPFYRYDTTCSPAQYDTRSTPCVNAQVTNLPRRSPWCIRGPWLITYATRPLRSTTMILWYYEWPRA